MTKREVSELLGYQFTVINKAFVAAEKHNETMRQKKGKYTKVLSIDYSLDECLDALSLYTPMEQHYLADHFIYRDTFYKDSRNKKVKLTKDIRDFIFLYKHAANFYAVCNTCKFLVPKKINKPGSRFHPYCTFYDCFLNKQKNKLNVYKDRCKSYKYGKRVPFLWLKEGPTNLDIFLEREEKILGRDKSDYTSKKTPKGEAIPLLKEEEWDMFDE